MSDPFFEAIKQSSRISVDIRQSIAGFSSIKEIQGQRTEDVQNLDPQIIDHFLAHPGHVVHAEVIREAPETSYQWKKQQASH